MNTPFYPIQPARNDRGEIQAERKPIQRKLDEIKIP